MGMLRESEDMQREADEILAKADDYQLLSTEVNACTDLSVKVRPLCYDVMLGSDNVISLNNVENAITIYHAMRADLKGEVYHG